MSRHATRLARSGWVSRPGHRLPFQRNRQRSPPGGRRPHQRARTCSIHDTRDAAGLASGSAHQCRAGPYRQREGDPRTGVGHGAFRRYQTNSSARSSPSKSTTGTPTRLAFNRNSTRPRPHERPALPEDMRPCSKPLSTDKNPASSAMFGADSTGEGRPAIGSSGVKVCNLVIVISADVVVHRLYAWWPVRSVAFAGVQRRRRRLRDLAGHRLSADAARRRGRRPR